ncbi:uncharacterized protein [Ptychodera flava]|uniref:uncharacterized protein isoform X1 n=1 Tax=Ptychodera flava TaxID=63121 RepID=UPI003969F716
MSATYRFSSRSLDIYSIDYASPAPKPSKKRKIDEVVSETKEKKACACKNNCTTNRCSCNKNGDACDEQCKCSACSNPMNMLKIMAEYGVDVEKCKEDICLMQNMERMTEEKLRKRLETEMELFCCDTKAKLYKLIPGKFRCPGEDCDEPYVYSWCDWEMSELSNGQRRNHCRKCHTCQGRCEKHCNKCYHCCWAPCRCHS